MQRNTRFGAAVGDAPPGTARQIDRHLLAIFQRKGLQCRGFAIVADAGDNPKRKALDDGRAVRPCAGLEDGFGFQGPGVHPGEACRAAVGDENLSVVGDGAGHSWKSRKCCDVPGVIVYHLEAIARGMGDEHPPGLGIEGTVIEFAARGIGILMTPRLFSGMTTSVATPRDTRNPVEMENEVRPCAISSKFERCTELGRLEPSGGEPVFPRIST